MLLLEVPIVWARISSKPFCNATLRGRFGDALLELDAASLEPGAHYALTLRLANFLGANASSAPLNVANSITMIPA